jgi:hypothetical protein
MAGMQAQPKPPFAAEGPSGTPVPVSAGQDSQIDTRVSRVPGSVQAKFTPKLTPNGQNFSKHHPSPKK